MKSRISSIIKIIIFLLLLLGIFFLIKNIFSEQEKEDKAPRQRTVLVNAISLEKSDIDNYEKTIGTIRNLNSINIASEVSGVVRSVNFEIGDYVRRGQILAIINDDELINNKISQEAEINRIKATVDDNERTLSRYQELIKEGFVSQAELDSTRVALEISKKQLESAIANLSNINLNIKKSSVRAEKSGFIQSRNISQGDFVSTGQIIFEIVDNSQVIIIVSLPERFINIIKKGTFVSVTSYGLEKAIETTVKEVQPLINEATRSLDIIIEIDNSKYNLKPGGTVDINILLERKKDIILVPESAVVLRNVGKVIYRLDRVSSKVSEVPVQTGLSLDSKVEIVKGVKEGDIIIVEGAGFLTDEALVQATIINQEKMVQQNEKDDLKDIGSSNKDQKELREESKKGKESKTKEDKKE